MKRTTSTTPAFFHFGAEKRASEPDRLSLNIHIPDEALRRIINSLYFPYSPYEFSVLSADILGQVYEQFLGKVIEISGGVRVEEKPEVRKAGGVYYTPAYIVDYIVENTVGDLLWGKSPKEAEKLRILDPGLRQRLLPDRRLSISAGLASQVLQRRSGALSQCHTRSAGAAMC